MQYTNNIFNNKTTKKMATHKIQTAKDATWTDASGDQVPYKFVTVFDRKKEHYAGKVVAEAKLAEIKLQQLHRLLTEATTEVYNVMLKDYELNKGKQKKQGKGSFTWYNFDRTIKIESDINEVVKWDEVLLGEAQELLSSYIGDNIGDANALIKSLVTDAFSNSKGGVDSRKIFQLLKYESQIKNQKFQKACALLKQAQGIDKTKLYMRVWVREADGSYRNINLNFSSI
jgi:hypothetical protein